MTIEKPVREYNQDGFVTHFSGSGGECWFEYDYEQKRVHFISSTGYDVWHYGWPSIRQKISSS